MAEKDILAGVTFDTGPNGDMDDAPGSVQEVIKRAEKAKAGKTVSTSVSLPESLIKRLRLYVYTRKAEGEDITLSSVMAKAIELHLKKLEKRDAS